VVGFPDGNGSELGDESKGSWGQFNLAEQVE